MHILLSERSQSNISHDSHYMAFWKRRNSGGDRRVSGGQRLGDRDGEAARGGFLSLVNLLYTQPWQRIRVP